MNSESYGAPNDKDLKRLKEWLKNAVETLGDKDPVIIRPNPDTKHGRIIDVLNAAGNVIHTVSGTDLPQFNGDQSAAITNQRVFFNFAPQDGVTALRLRSNGMAFEFDNIAATGAVPEPASWAMLIIGFGLIGAMMRRPRRAGVSA